MDNADKLTAYTTKTKKKKKPKKNKKPTQYYIFQVIIKQNNNDKQYIRCDNMGNICIILLNKAELKYQPSFK